ncbi:MAG: NAD(+)/NADH kinase [Ruminococcaceae bacterium]|nr:NAD(+)/NADH kinase [Oscillospiraceae bacterium]
MNFLFILNPNKLNSVDCATRAIHILKARGCEVYTLPLYVEKFQNLAVKEFKMGDDPSLIDMVVTIGGDGTLIHSAEKALELDKPIVGINSGRLGFLTELEHYELESLQQLADGDFEIQDRMILEVDHYHQKGGCDRYLAVNDAVISKEDMNARVADIDVVLRSGYVNGYRADGLIFSTPTGSTAYSLSAGGPIVCAGMQAIIVTPICPHSLFFRSMVYGPQEELTVQGKYINNSDTLVMSIDGKDVVKIAPGDWVQIKRSQQSMKYVVLNKNNYYKKLTENFSNRR